MSDPREQKPDEERQREQDEPAELEEEVVEDLDTAEDVRGGAGSSTGGYAGTSR